MEGAPLTAFLAMLRSVPPTEPILVLGTAECEFKQLDPGLKKDIFGFSRKNCLEVSRPAQVSCAVLRRWWKHWWLITTRAIADSTFP